MPRRDSPRYRRECLDFALAMANGTKTAFLCEKTPPPQWLSDWPGHAVFYTSGTTSEPTPVLFHHDILRHSATQVNQLQTTTSRDITLIALPVHHIAGFSQLTRATLAHATIEWFPHAWNPLTFLNCLQNTHATLTSLVPTQITDIVAHNLRPPRSLREVLLGGSTCPHNLLTSSLNLGWPIRETYGMTETASQIATRLSTPSPHIPTHPPFTLLPGWEAKTTPDSRLAIRGPSLASGFLQKQSNNNWILTPLTDSDGWFLTNDLVELPNKNQLTLLGRADPLIKIRGIWTNPSTLRLRLESTHTNLTLLPLPHPRTGHDLWLIAETQNPTSDEALLALCQPLAPPHAPFKGIKRVLTIPRNTLGKCQISQLHNSLRHQPEA